MKDYGNAIKVLRKRNDMTQSTLAEKLNISFQAVSKWENNLAQPDFDTILKMTEIFNTTLDEFTRLSTPITANATHAEKVTSATPHTTPANQRLIGVCSNCGTSIYDEEQVGSRTPKLICKTCKTNLENKAKEEKRLKDLAIQKAAKEKYRAEEIKKQVNFSKFKKTLYIPAIIILCLLAIAIIVFLVGDFNNKGILIGISCGAAVLAYLATPQVLWIDNAIAGIFTFTFRRSFRMPGLIIGLDIDSLIWAICVKFFLILLSVFLSVVVSAAGIALCMILAPFFFPISICTTLRDIRAGEDFDIL